MESEAIPQLLWPNYTFKMTYLFAAHDGGLNGDDQNNLVFPSNCNHFNDSFCKVELGAHFSLVKIRKFLG